jgi:hypothetical protein
METPPPPSSRLQESEENLDPLSSTDSSSLQIRDCKERINEVTRSNDSRFTETFLCGKLSRSSYFVKINEER